MAVALHTSLVASLRDHSSNATSASSSSARRVQPSSSFLCLQSLAVSAPATCQQRATNRLPAVRCSQAAAAAPAQPTLQGMPALPHVNWSARAIKAFGMAELEARKLKYPTTGTEALLMGMLTEGTSMASRFLRSKGVRLFALRDETVKLLGKADMYYFSPEHPTLTPQAEKALQWAINEHKRLSLTGEVGPELILLGIWEQKEEGAGYRLLCNLGFKPANAEELRRLIVE